VRIPDLFHRFWVALDGLFSDVRDEWWGAIVTDGRFPRIWDANYARVDAEGVRLHDLEHDLTQALRAIGATTFHVVVFDPEGSPGLLTDLSSRAHRLSWDVLMEATSEPPPNDVRIDALGSDDALWAAVRDSFGLFGVDPRESVAQLKAIETDVLTPGGKRWYGVRGDDGEIVSLAALLVLDSVGYIDNVATFPHARGRGYASALASHLVRTAADMGTDATFLIADPDDQPVVRLYERIGFREVGRLASTKGPIPSDHATNL
jgi:ribosomal protein S18 acetylase RimI-like enzyme